MEQTKALIALEPFLALCKSATHPRAAADLIAQATSAPDTYVFAELLQQPQILALAQNDQFSSHLRLLQTFSYGTWQSYHHDATNLPPLNDAQALKLRQLSLITLARKRSNLKYGVLQESLELSSPRDLEELVITAIFAGLLRATLDPAHEVVQVASVAPLRDVQPGSVPDMVAALSNWSDKCSSTLTDLENQIQTIRAAAATRESERIIAEKTMESLAKKGRLAFGRDALPQRSLSNRSAQALTTNAKGETMEIDEPSLAEDQTQRANKRKM